MIIKPTPEQVEWANCEIGVIIHLDLITFAAPYNMYEHYGDPLPPSVFNPTRLSTDQWVKSASELGAKYAVLVAKHGTGFSLWPTEAHEYSVKSSPYKDGKGDIVAEFIESCKKYDVRPGIYCSASSNQYFRVLNPGRVDDGDPEKQKKYNEIVIKQLTELWTKYGDLFEIWFDGGVIPVEEGGPDVKSLLHKLQPNAVVFQGPIGTRSLLRWVGNERGIAPEDCSALYESKHLDATGLIEYDNTSTNRPEVWCPAESDFPNRDSTRSYQGGWFWREGEEHTVFSADYLFERYLTSVGRNSNMLVGMAINDEGRFSDYDAEQFKLAGELIRGAFGAPVARGNVADMSVELPDGAKCAKYIVLGEDIAEGELVTGYTVHAFDKENREIFTHEGKVIGHKRILELPEGVKRAALEITSSRAEPKIKFIELY